jgi:hypothetical protein
MAASTPTGTMGRSRNVTLGLAIVRQVVFRDRLRSMRLRGVDPDAATGVCPHGRAAFGVSAGGRARGPAQIRAEGQKIALGDLAAQW